MWTWLDRIKGFKYVVQFGTTLDMWLLIQSEYTCMYVVFSLQCFDVQLNSSMRLISCTLCSTSLPWLPVLSNIEPPALRRKAATDKLANPA